MSKKNKRSSIGGFVSRKATSFFFSRFFWYLVAIIFIWLKWDDFLLWWHGLSARGRGQAAIHYKPESEHSKRSVSDSDLERVAKNIYLYGSGAIGTNEEPILNYLSKLNIHDLNFLNYAYGTKDNMDLGRALADELSGDDLNEARTYCRGSNIYIP